MALINCPPSPISIFVPVMRTNITSAAPPMLPSMYDLSQLQQPTVTNSPASSSSAILTAGIIIMTLLIILSAVLCLIFRHGHRLPCILPRRGSNHLPSASATGDVAVNSLPDSLPLFTFSSVTRPSDATALSSAIVKADCAVCLSRFVSRDTLRLLPLCCHAFHSQCIDTWLSSGHKTCPLCRSDVYASAASILLPPASSGTPNGSFHLEIGSVSRRHNDSTTNGLRSYSVGTFDYVVEAEAEVIIADKEDRVNEKPEVANLHCDGSKAIAGAPGNSGSWLGEYMDGLSSALSSRTASFRSSRWFFTGSSRRNDDAGVGEWDIEASRVGEEISELFRWASWE